MGTLPGLPIMNLLRTAGLVLHPMNMGVNPPPVTDNGPVVAPPAPVTRMNRASRFATHRPCVTHKENTVHTLSLSPLNNAVWRVVHSEHGHVGNLKLIGGVWKFKAVGYGAGGEVIPGGGPLTDRHNTVLAAPDEALLNAAFGSP